MGPGNCSEPASTWVLADEPCGDEAGGSIIPVRCEPARAKVAALERGRGPVTGLSTYVNTSDPNDVPTNELGN